MPLNRGRGCVPTRPIRGAQASGIHIRWSFPAMKKTADICEALPNAVVLCAAPRKGYRLLLAHIIARARKHDQVVL